MINTFLKTISLFLMGIFITLSLTSCDSNSTVNINDPTLESFVLNAPDEIPVGMTAQFNAVATIKVGPETISDIVNDEVNWSSSDPAIATVDAAGLATAIAEGTVNIMAAAKINGNIESSRPLTVSPGVLTSIQIERGYNPSVPQVITTLDVGITEEEYITAWGIYSDGTRRYINAEAFWWSSDQQIASINSFVSSNVLGRDLGTATVTAYFGGLEASIAVTVIQTGPTLISIEIRDGWGTDPTDITNMSFNTTVGQNAPVVAYGHYDDLTVKDINARVAWSSSDLGVAFILDEISSSVYGISVGTARITATWQGVSAYTDANVTESTEPTLLSIEIQKNYVADGKGEVIDIANPLDITIGDSLYITAWGIYDDGTKQYINTRVFWLSDDNAIASMSLLQLNSNVTGVSAGTTEVSAKLLGFGTGTNLVEGRATVNVTP